MALPRTNFPAATLVAQGVLLFLAGLYPAMAQTAPDSKAGNQELHVFHLANATSFGSSGEIAAALRNMLSPTNRVFTIDSQNAILMSGSDAEIAAAQRLITELDRPKKVYKLTYTLAEVDNGKRVGVQHFDVVVLSGQKVVLKQGSKVPIVTGGENGKSANVQFTYLDVGINIDAEVIQGGDRVTLKTKVERSSVAEEASAFGAQDPIIRQALVEGEVNLESGKPLIIGSMDVVGSTRHIDVDVVAQTLP